MASDASRLIVVIAIAYFAARALTVERLLARPRQAVITDLLERDRLGLAWLFQCVVCASLWTTLITFGASTFIVDWTAPWASLVVAVAAANYLAASSISG